MDTIDLIKDVCLFGGTVPNERVNEVKAFLDKAEALQLLQLDVSNAKRTLAIKFANSLLNDFEMTQLENGDLRWNLCGVPTKMTSDEVYDRYIDEILANDC